jgi:hypothetical protein
MSHLQGVVKTPKRGAERVTDSSKPTTGRSVSLEHEEWFVLGLCVSSGIEVWGDYAFARIVVKE